MFSVRQYHGLNGIFDELLKVGWDGLEFRDALNAAPFPG
jgi:hypothetical protein